MFVPHSSGLRLVVDEVAIENAWAGVLEGVPTIEMFVHDAKLGLARYPGREQRLIPVAWQNAANPVRLDAEGRTSIWTPERRAPDTPRWRCTAAVRFDDGRPEGERQAAFCWFTNRALARGIEELLVEDLAYAPLDDEAPARAPDGPRDASFVVASDGAEVRLHELRVRFDVNPAELHGIAQFGERAHLLPKPRHVDAPVFARAAFSGSTIQGPRNPDPGGYYTSSLEIAWIAESPAQPLGAFVQEAIGRVRWHELATPGAP